MPSSSFSSFVRETPSSGCISSPATRTKKRGPPNCSCLSCSRSTWQTFWHRKHSMHLRNACTRSKCGNALVHSVVPRDIGDQILDHGKRLHGEDRDRFVLVQSIHARLAGQP